MDNISDNKSGALVSGRFSNSCIRSLILRLDVPPCDFAPLGRPYASHPCIFALALATSLAFTYGVRTWARQWSFVDRPDGHRKIQREPVALGGGVAIYAACFVTLTFLALTRSSWDWVEIQSVFMLPGYIVPAVLNFYQICLLFIASGILCLVGLYDDRYHLRGRTKLLWQILACAIIVYSPGEGATLFPPDHFPRRTDPARSNRPADYDGVG